MNNSTYVPPNAYHRAFATPPRVLSPRETFSPQRSSSPPGYTIRIPSSNLNRI